MSTVILLTARSFLEPWGKESSGTWQLCRGSVTLSPAARYPG